MHESDVGFQGRPPSTPSDASFVSVYHRIHRLFALYGATGLMRLFAAKLIGFALWWTPSRRRARNEAQERDLEFDRKWGVDTSGSLIPAESGVIGSRWIHGCRYQGVDADTLEQVLVDLSIDHKAFTFIDFGSGKGRAVLTAARFPFQKVIGVEYSEMLNNIAKQNVSVFRMKQNVCDDISLVWADALDFPIPAGPLIIFMYNPFGEAVMKELVQRISESFEKERRRVIVLYFWPTCSNLWQNAGFLEEVLTASHVAIFDSQGN